MRKERRGQEADEERGVMKLLVRIRGRWEKKRRLGIFISLLQIRALVVMIPGLRK